MQKQRVACLLSGVASWILRCSRTISYRIMFSPSIYPSNFKSIFAIDETSVLNPGAVCNTQVDSGVYIYV